MVKKKPIIAGILILFVLTLILITTINQQTKIVFPDQTRIAVEIADTDDERRIGLSHHIFLDQDRGMLFLFDRPDRYAFWMKDMNFPIDIVWMLDGIVVDVSEQVPVSTGVTFATYVPNAPVNQVLELNAGFIQKHPLVLGEKITVSQ